MLFENQKHYPKYLNLIVANTGLEPNASVLDGESEKAYKQKAGLALLKCTNPAFLKN